MTSEGLGLGLGLEASCLVSWPSSCGFVSMNATVGPAMSWDVARFAISLSKGWPSDVTQMTTGPSMSWGMIQSFRGRGIELRMPPMSI